MTGFTQERFMLGLVAGLILVLIEPTITRLMMRPAA
jgi:hypothetical protein